VNYNPLDESDIAVVAIIFDHSKDEDNDFWLELDPEKVELMRGERKFR